MTQSVSPPTPAPSSTPRFNKLKRVLEELFQFDQADLDFGIYHERQARRAYALFGG